MTQSFKWLNKASRFFLEQARQHKSTTDEYRFNVVSSVICSWMLLEAYFNYVSDILGEARLEPHKRILLEDKEFRLNEEGQVVEITSHMPILKRVLFILNEFSSLDAKKLKQSKRWHDIKSAEDLRNGLIHQKKGFTLQSFDVDIAETTRRSVVEFVKMANRAMFSKSLDL